MVEVTGALGYYYGTPGQWLVNVTGILGQYYGTNLVIITVRCRALADGRKSSDPRASLLTIGMMIADLQLSELRFYAVLNLTRQEDCVRIMIGKSWSIRM